MARKIIPLKREKHEPKLSRAEQSQRANRTILRRTLVLMVLFGVVVFIPLIVTLYNLMIRDHDYYEAQAIDNQTRYTSLSASRGQIFDRNMNVLASSKTVETVFIDPNEIAQEMTKPENSNLLDHIARGLSEILDVSTDFVYKQAEDKAFRYKVIRRKIPEELADEVRSFVSENEIKGVYLETDAQRYYPYSSLAAQVMGFVSTDNVGSEGLEAYYDSYLQGTAGKVVTTKGNYGSEMLYTYEKYYDASDGDSLVTTIDQTVQHYLEKNLETAIEKYDIINGAFGIVMDVNSGQILAMANLGSYDPNNYQEIYDQALAGQLEAQYQDALLLDKDSDAYQEAMSAYNQAVAAERLRQWRNRCVSDGYEPGSTFKLVTLAAALDCGAVTENSTFYCGGHETFNDREQEVSCWKAAGHGMQTTMEALGHSCNIAFGHIGVNMTRKTFVEYFKAFGFLEKTGVDLPGEASGLFWAEDKFSVANLISASFGQTFRVTPMEQVRAVAAIVNGGYLLKPYVVSQVLDSDGNVVKSNERTVLRQVISEETSATMRKMMEYVVTDGTAGSAKTPGYRVGGKTGTSEKIDTYDENGKPVEDKIVSFIGVAPIDDPKYVVLVALDTPNYVAGTSYTPHNQYISGGLMAAPTVRDIFLDILPYLGVEPDYSSDDIRGVNITLPDVIGMTEDEAAALLSGKSITYRTVGQGSTVTDQLPSPGAEVPGNSEIILYFGNAVKTTEQVEVPDFVGYGIADVDYLATNAGLYIQAKGTDHRDEYVTVAYQDIEPGTMVDRGTTITVEFTTGGASD
ncbi:MAG: penicillin-binding transpeptidase domain-containing protein [Oscillospiraceae bacterium]|nr:penicillin-binding transpeptidase domain-containing protein [Oscillospiraceae bacterium]